MTSNSPHNQDDLGIKDSLQAPGRAASSITGGYKQGKEIIQLLRECAYGLMIAFCSIFTMPVEIIAHRTHGIRTITLARFVPAMIAMGAIAAVPLIASEAARSFDLRGIGVVTLIGLAVLALLVRRWRLAWRRFKAGERVYTKATSDPYGFWYRLPRVRTQWQVMRWAEPLTLIVVGAAGFAVFRSGLFLYVATAGVALLLKHTLTQKRINERLMDAMDAEIEASEITSALKGNSRKAEPDHGFVVPVVVPPTRATSPKR